MKNKIREGKVPGVTDPEEASRLIRRGHLTYTQARNITRFGTIESVTYDIAEGSVVSLAAGGISFALTASVFWLSTGDRDAALQTAAVQAGKTFTRTLAVYVTTQQLHRLSVVQGMLKHIDFSTASPTVRQALQKGTGAGNISALNKVMKGSLVTSLALVAVTTGPDMIKMLRGRISGAQFIRNLAVASSCVAGGAVGSVAGGILFSPLGPFGALTGRVVGGVLGGMIASAVSGKIAGALVEEDRVKILAMIQEQVTWLAGSFLLTGHEIENLNANLARVIDQNALEIIFAAGIQQRAATNMLIKPLVVSIIRQRPVMEYDASHLGNMVNRLEETLPPELPAYRLFCAINVLSPDLSVYSSCQREVSTIIHLFKTCMITAFILGLTWSAPLRAQDQRYISIRNTDTIWLPGNICAYQFRLDNGGNDEGFGPLTITLQLKDKYGQTLVTRKMETEAFGDSNATRTTDAFLETECVENVATTEIIKATEESNGHRVSLPLSVFDPQDYHPLLITVSGKNVN